MNRFDNGHTAAPRPHFLDPPPQPQPRPSLILGGAGLLLTMTATAIGTGLWLGLAAGGFIIMPIDQKPRSDTL